MWFTNIQTKTRKFEKIKNKITMDLKFTDLNIETTLENFISDWEPHVGFLNSDEIIKEIKNDPHSITWGGGGFFKFTKENDVLLNVSIDSGFDEVINYMNEIYDEKYLLLRKSVYHSNNTNQSYTVWEVMGVNPDEEIVFHGGEGEVKRICSSDEIKDFENLEYSDIIGEDDEHIFIKDDNLDKTNLMSLLKEFDYDEK